MNGAFDVEFITSDKIITLVTEEKYILLAFVAFSEKRQFSHGDSAGTPVRVSLCNRSCLIFNSKNDSIHFRMYFAPLGMSLSRAYLWARPSGLCESVFCYFL